MQIFDERLTLQNPPHFFDYSGVANVHTNFSSGSGSFKEVILSAQDSALDFIFLTDLSLNESKNLPPFKKLKALEGYYEKLLVFMNGEFSYLDSRLLHYNATDFHEFSSAAQTQNVLSDYLSRKSKDKKHGIFVLAHPFKRNYKWSGEYPIGLDGIEVLNLSSLWQTVWKEKRFNYFKALLLYPFNFQLALTHLLHLPSKELKLWDRLNKKRKTLGLSGTDAKGKSHFLFLNIKAPSYAKLFKILRNHVILESELTGNASIDRKKISHAIREGHFFMSFDFLENAKGFISYIQKEESIYKIGSEIKWEKDLFLQILFPQKPFVPIKTIVYKDGKTHFISEDDKIKKPIPSPGIYRIIVFIQPNLPFWRKTKWVPWIFTNPFYITSK